MISCYRLKGLRHPIFDYNMDFVRRNTHSNTDSNTQTNSGSVPLKLLHVYYNLYNIRVAHKPITTLRWRLLMSRTKTKRRKDSREQYTRSNAATARLLTLVKQAENLSRRLIEHKRATRNGDVNNGTLLSTVYRRNIELTGTLVSHYYILVIRNFFWFYAAFQT